MLKFLIPAFLFLNTLVLSAQDFARVSMVLNQENHAALDALGIETDHGMVIPGQLLTTDLSYSEINTLRNNGVQVKILIPDVQKHYARQNDPKPVSGLPEALPCGSGLLQSGVLYPTPQNYTAGSMGGYFTYEELLENLDRMHDIYPDLVSARATTSDTLLTAEGRPVWWVKISDNPDLQEDEPEALYTALHHAREPMGMTQLVFFMWYLLENYNTHPEIKYLVDQTQLCFIPCVNPDGYIYNQTTNPEGGGLWRKNRSLNSDGSYGTDLNRNYGYQWGVDDQGSSGLPYTGTYRGPAPFSEAETKMVRDFCRAHQFKIALNYHSFGNLMIYPWAYSDSAADPFFPFLADALVAANNFRPGPPALTVGYPVNGSSDDWMFAEPGTFSFTPETGPNQFSFWPPADTIDGLNKVTMSSNLTAGWSLLNFATAADLSDYEIYTSAFTIPVAVSRYGFKEGNQILKITALSAEVDNLTPASVTVSIPQMGVDTLDFTGIIAPNTPSGTLLDFEISLDNGAFIQRDTIHKIYMAGPRIPVFADAFNADNNWVGGWNLTGESFVSPPSSLADSPNEPYFNNASNSTELTDFIFIPDAPFPQLNFFAKWTIETGYDWVQIEAVDMAGNATPLCGQYSHFGGIHQPAGVPLWDGTQLNWVEESIDLSPFKGQSIKIRSTINSDSELVLDGFYIDDLAISYVDTTTISSVNDLGVNTVLAVQPNPAHQNIRLEWQNLPDPSQLYTFEMVNTLGQLVMRQNIGAAISGKENININLPAGTYTWFIRSEKWVSAGQKLVIE